MFDSWFHSFSSQHQSICDDSLIMREMNEREGRKRLILRIEKRNDCFEREREIECVIYEMRMSGHGWLLLRRWIDDDLYDRY